MLQGTGRNNNGPSDAQAIALIIAVLKGMFWILYYIIKYRWYRQIFTAFTFLFFTGLGLSIPLIIHMVIHDNIGSFNGLFAIPLYVIFIPFGIYLGVKLSKRLWRWYRMNDGYTSPTTPRASDAMREHYDDVMRSHYGKKK